MVSFETSQKVLWRARVLPAQRALHKYIFFQSVLLQCWLSSRVRVYPAFTYHFSKVLDFLAFRSVPNLGFPFIHRYPQPPSAPLSAIRDWIQYAYSRYRHSVAMYSETTYDSKIIRKVSVHGRFIFCREGAWSEWLLELWRFVQSRICLKKVCDCVIQ